MKIGILALQGGFAKHAEMVQRLGCDVQLIRKADQLQECDGLILPGGESTAMLRLIQKEGLDKALQEFQKPIFGTCAGLILMAKQIENYKQKSFGWLDVSIDRNGYGTQINSFQTNVIFNGNDFPAIFIRAPRIRSVGLEVTVLATYNNEPILIQQGNYLGATFHPELTENTAIHEIMVKAVLSSKNLVPVYS